MNLNNKKVLVTGADGFIGSHLVEALIREGCRVKALAYYNSFNNWGWLEDLTKDDLSQIEVITGDVRDENGMRTVTKNVDIILHLAALIGIPYSYEAPASYVDTNVKGTLNILQAARDFNIEKTLITSTSEVYGTAQFIPITEEHPRRGQSPYSATKISADALTDSYSRNFGLPVVTVRPFNTFGPRQSARAIIPTVITQLLADNGEVHLGTLDATRDLLFVEDTVQGFIEIAKSNDVNGKEINIASGEEISIGALAEKLIAMIKPEAKIALDNVRVRPEKSEVLRLLGDNSQLRSLTQWSQKYSLEEGLEKTIKWFKQEQRLESYKSEIYNV